MPRAGRHRAREPGRGAARPARRWRRSQRRRPAGRTAPRVGSWRRHRRVATAKLTLGDNLTTRAGRPVTGDTLCRSRGRPDEHLACECTRRRPTSRPTPLPTDTNRTSQPVIAGLGLDGGGQSCTGGTVSAIASVAPSPAVPGRRWRRGLGASARRRASGPGGSPAESRGKAGATSPDRPAGHVARPSSQHRPAESCAKLHLIQIRPSRR